MKFKTTLIITELGMLSLAQLEHVKKAIDTLIDTAKEMQ